VDRIKFLFFPAKNGPNFKVEDDFNNDTYFGFEACHEFVVNLVSES
jgi:hypothetical protein